MAQSGAHFQLSSLPSGHHLRYIGDVAVLVLHDFENRLNLASVRAMDKCLDYAERNTSTKALVLTGVGKFFCNGIDLKWLSTQPGPIAQEYFEALKAFYLRLCTFPLPTVAAINGHAFAGGAILALVCDFRVMHSGKGWFSLPEVHIGLPFTPFFNEIISLKSPNPQVTRDMVLWGKRYTPAEALQHRLVEAVVPPQDLVQFACDLATTNLGKNGIDRNMMKTMKDDLYGVHIRDKSILREDGDAPIAPIATSRL